MAGRVAAGAEAEPPAAAHSAKGQAATASNLRWRVLTVDDTMLAPPLPQDGETKQRAYGCGCGGGCKGGDGDGDGAARAAAAPAASCSSLEVKNLQDLLPLQINVAANG